MMDIIEGLRVDSRRHRGGVCTGKTRSDDGDGLGPRAEVTWPNGMVRWPLVSILAPSTTPAPCPCVCNSGGFCVGCGHAGCGRRGRRRHPDGFVNDNHWTSTQLGDSRDV